MSLAGGNVPKLKLQARSVILEAQSGNTLTAVGIIKDLSFDVHHIRKF